MRAINFLLGMLAALLVAAALGAIWSLAGLAGSGRASWFAPVAALALALVLRFNNHSPGTARALVCALLLALTAAHANYLMAAGFIAGQMGLELLDALHIIGLDMAYSVARAHSDGGDVIAYAIALAVALLLGFRQPGEAAPKVQPGRRKR